MTTYLQSKPGLSSTTTLNIPKDWDPTWFRNFISNQLKGADVRNAVGANGITVSGTIASPYATIGFGAPVTLPGPVTINGTPNTLTLNIQGGVIEVNETGNGNQILLDAAGADYGVIGVSASQTWFLGYAASLATAPTPVLSWSQPGQVTVNGGVNGSAFTVNAASTGASAVCAIFNNGAGSQTWSVEVLNPNAASGTNYGLLIEAGRTSADYGLYVTNYNNTASAPYLTVNGIGGVGIGVGSGTSAGVLNVANQVVAGDYFQTGQGAYLMVSTVAFTNGSGAGAGTLTNAPAAGNPTKWIAIDDNGTVRHIPAW